MAWFFPNPSVLPAEMYTLKMGAVSSSETPVNYEPDYMMPQITRHNVSIHCCENLDEVISTMKMAAKPVISPAVP
jgi:hypothetical protein